MDRYHVESSFDIWHEVPLVPQLTGMSCWAAAAAMIVGWRDTIDVRAEDVVRGLGRWDAYRDGLEPHDVLELARAFGLVVEPSRTYMVAELRGLLQRYGPLWVGEAVPGLHVVVVAGMYGDGTPTGTWVRIADPWPIGRGERYRLSFLDFSRNLAAASDLVGATAQVLHAAGRITDSIGSALAAPHSPRIVLDPGHGGWHQNGHSSAYGVHGPGGALEKDVNLSVARLVADRLGGTVSMTRTDDVNPTLGERTDHARRAGAGIFLSLHANGGQPGSGGAEVWVHERANPESLLLASAMQRELGPLRGAQLWRGPMAVLTPERLGPRTASCLLEVEHLGDPAGEARLRDPRELERIADAVARGVAEYSRYHPAG